MKQALIERGIPGDRIVCDLRGSADLGFGGAGEGDLRRRTPILFISQRFQNERAIYLAKANGIEAYGFNAQDVETQAGLKTKIREVGARVKMWLDVNFLNTRPTSSRGERSAAELAAHQRAPRRWSPPSLHGKEAAGAPTPTAKLNNFNTPAI